MARVLPLLTVFELPAPSAPPTSQQVPQHLEAALENLSLNVRAAAHQRQENGITEWNENDFELGRTIGRGKFGSVFLARERLSHFPVALKVLMKSELKNENEQDSIMREIKAHSILRNHDNLQHMLQYFVDESRIFLVMEYVSGGDMLQKLQDAHRFENLLCAQYIYQVASALDFCHENHVLHADIKPENLLISARGNVKIADFGWFVDVSSQSDRIKARHGSRAYFPPEMVNDMEYSYLVDNWCVGVLCYELLVGRPPFGCKSTRKTYKRIRAARVNFPNHVSPFARDLIMKLLKPNPMERLSLKEVQVHPFIAKYWTAEPPVKVEQVEEPLVPVNMIEHEPVELLTAVKVEQVEEPLVPVNIEHEPVELLTAIKVEQP